MAAGRAATFGLTFGAFITHGEPVAEAGAVKATDRWVVNALQLLLVVLLGIDIVARLARPSGSHGTLTTGHSAPSMTFLYFVFAAAVAAYTFVLREAEAYKGHKAFLYVCDLAALIFLFFLAEWFRENVIFRFYGFVTG